MQAFNQFLDIELENYHTLKDPYEVERRAVRGDGDSEGTEVYPLRISEDKVLLMYNKALEDNKCAPCSAIYTTGLQGGLMAYEAANPGHLSHRIGEITAAYYGAVQDANRDEEPVLVESDECYEGMSRMVCKVVQYLARKLSYTKKCRSYEEYQRWEDAERTSLWPMVLASAWMSPLYHMIPFEEQLTEQIDKLHQEPQAKVKSEGNKTEEDDYGTRATRLLDIPREEDTTPAETLVMLKNIKGAENRAKKITSIQWAVQKHKKLRQKFNTWLAQRMEEPASSSPTTKAS